MNQMHTLNWNPFSITEVVQLLEPFTGWFIDGGVSLDLFLGRTTREHDDLDIGVFSTHARTLLTELCKAGYNIYIANKKLAAYQDQHFSPSDYNYWVSDGSDFKLQVLAYPVESGNVRFRRNDPVCWPIDHFVVHRNGVPIINPLVSYAFKVTTREPQEKDLNDIRELMSWVGDHA